MYRRIPAAIVCLILASGFRPGGAAAGAARDAAPTHAANVEVADTEPLRAIAIAEDERRWSEAALGAFLRHADAPVRARAALAAGRLQDSTAVPALLPLLADPSPEVRQEAVFALGQIGHR